MTPVLIDETSHEWGEPSDVLIMAASWEDRCTGLVSKLPPEAAKLLLLTAYDGPSPKREANIRRIKEEAGRIGKCLTLDALHANPIANVRKTIDTIKALRLADPPRIMLDASTFTRKHFLQLLQGLELSGMLANVKIFHTEPLDYHTHDNEPIAEGVSSISAIETFGGSSLPSKDSLLILLLGYEGRRALALLENLEPNRAIAVIGDPPYRHNWKGRAEAQNRYLLSCLPSSHVFKSHSLEPASTQRLLETLSGSGDFGSEKYNYFIGALGTKPQMVGLYRFWRERRGEVTIVYASPRRYKEEQADFPAGRTWLIDDTRLWKDYAE